MYDRSCEPSTPTLSISKHTGRPIEQVERDTDRDRFMSAEDAKVYGLVDQVISHQAELVAAK